MKELESVTQGAVLLACGLAIAALVVTLALRAAGRKRVGRVLCSEAPRDVARVMRALWIAATLVVVGIQLGDAPQHSTLLLMGLVLFLAVATPAVNSQICGELGVMRGWHARSFADLEEWRLTGEHLRWKLYGEWQACRAPTALQAELRERLSQACPERESPFA